jgi:hypothetical protein
MTLSPEDQLTLAALCEFFPMKPYPILFATALGFASVLAQGAESTLANGTAANISNRALSGPGGDASITGFVIKDAPTFVLIRAVGPGLAQFGVTGYASGTTFDLLDARGTRVTQGKALNEFPAASRESMNTRYRALGAFPLPTTSADSYDYLCLNPGSYTVVARPAGASPGIILTEVYFDPTGLDAREPIAFETTAAATDYANKLFAGGQVDVVKVGSEDVLVLQTFGSGLPVLFLGIYRWTGSKWKLAAEWRPQNFQLRYTIKERNGDVVAVGNSTGEEWVLLDL